MSEFAEQEKVDAEADAEAEASAKYTAREVVARWMQTNGFATGHGDSLYDLLRELEWQVNELKRAALQGSAATASPSPSKLGA